MSGHETLMSPDVMHKPYATKEVWLEITNQTLKMVRIWCAVNHYLGGGCKKIGHFLHAKSYYCLSET